MNELQEKIFDVIISIINTKGILDKFKSEDSRKKRIIDHASIRYGLINYIAKYSLANDKYFITSKCEKHIKNQGLINNGKLLRSSKGSKNKFTFEHPVPCNLIANEVIKNKGNNNKIIKILQSTDLVTILTYEENILINKHGLAKKMPENSFINGEMFARYELSGIEKPIKKIDVYGALAR